MSAFEGSENVLLLDGAADFNAHLGRDFKVNERVESSSVGLTTNHSGLKVLWVGGEPKAASAPSWSGHLVAKRVVDVVLSASGLLVLAPLLLLVAIAIKMESAGPAFFVQSREGCDGVSFKILKFRSMRTTDCDVSGVAQTVQGDPRVTRIGRFIRRTSIDELPQLINVLLGNMSIVGPRPHVAGMLAAGLPYKVAVPYYDARLAMKPGITGWAQANGLRGGTDELGEAKARVDHDIAYIQNFSIWLDLRIVLMTAAREFITGSGH